MRIRYYQSRLYTTDRLLHCTVTIAIAIATAVPFLPILGHSIPQIGLGVYQLEGDSCRRIVAEAIKDVGWRCIDSAQFYRNEKEVGRGVREVSISQRERGAGGGAR